MSDEVRAEKECPKCAETIKRKAIVCRFCGYEYSEEEIKKDEEEIKKEEEKIKKEKEEIDAAEQARLESLKTTYKNIIITETDEGEYEVLGKTFKSLKTASDYIDFAEDQGMISDKSGKQADD